MEEVLATAAVLNRDRTLTACVTTLMYLNPVSQDLWGLGSRHQSFYTDT